MRDLNKVAEKMTALWSGGKFHKVKPTAKPENTTKQIVKEMSMYNKGKK